MSSQIEPRSSRWIPWTFVGLFAVMLIANGALVFFALDSWTGLSTKHAYQRGITYNRVLADERVETALGWRLATSLVATEPGRGRIEVRIEDRAGTPVDDAEVRALLRRPLREGFDAKVALDALGGGRYAAAVAVPLPGQWEVRVLARRGADSVHDRARFTLP